MAASRLIEILAAALACAAALPVALAAEPLAQLQSKGPISLNTDSYEVDFRSGKTVMRNVTISQGDVSIQADRAEATGIEFNDSHWEFSGNVRINAEKRGSLKSDRAVVEFSNNRIARATVKGTPAQFEQRREGSAQTARGRAGEIVYEVGAGTVRFANDAWLTNGQNEISGPLLVYNIRQEKVQATTSPDGAQRVQITIVPKDAKAPPKPEAAPPQGGAPGETAP